jgi:hypothetical protein
MIGLILSVLVIALCITNFIFIKLWLLADEDTVNLQHKNISLKARLTKAEELLGVFYHSKDNDPEIFIG